MQTLPAPRTLRLKLWIITLTTLMMLPAMALADDGALEVSVTDALTQRPLANVRVVIESRDGESVETTTAVDGSARIDGLAGGYYRLQVDGEGYTTAVEPSVRIIDRRTLELPFQLIRPSEDIEEVVVTARAREADRWGSVSNTYFNREELRNAAGSGSDVMRALTGAPGLVTSGEFASFSVRGHGPKKNLIYVDGFPFQQVAHFEHTLGEEEDIIGGGRYSIFAPNSVKGAEYSPGGWSAQYAGRNASLLELELVGGAPDPVASLRIDIAGAELLYEGPSGLHDNTSMFLQARRFDFGKLFELIDEEDLGDPVSTDVILKTVTEFDEDNEFEFLAIYAPEEYDRDMGHILAAENYEDLVLHSEDQDLGLVGFSWRRLFGSNGEWTNRFYYHHFDKESTEGEAFPDLVPEGTPEDQVPALEDMLTVIEDETEIGWRSDISMGNRFGLFTAGVHVRQTDLDYSVNLRDDWVRYVYRSTDPRPPGQNYIVLRPSEVNSEFSESETNYAIYGEQVFDWGPAQLRTGLRYDRDGFSDEDLFSPRIGFNYEYSSDLRLSATAGLFYESPRHLVRASNPDNYGLESEQLIHLGTGFEYRIGGGWTLLGEGYYQWLDDLLVPEGRTTTRVSNNGDGSNMGADFLLTRYFDNGWAADLTYSWNRFRRDDNDGRGEYDHDFSRSHYFSVGGRWEINDRWQVAARWKYGSGTPEHRYVVHEDIFGTGSPLRYSKELTELNVRRMDAFHALDVRVDYRRQLGPVDMVLFLDVLNLYGGPSISPAEFDVTIGEEVDEEEETLPLIGLIFEYAW